MLWGLAAGASLFAAAPASAQFFMKPANLAGPRVTGAEPGIVGSAMPLATADELRAALVWNLRAALNVAALQCQFEPTLLTLGNYNALLTEHGAELKKSYDVLEGYFVRVNGKNKKKGQTELDRFGTRVYSGFSTVSAQLSFCQVAGSIAHDAMFLKKGQLGDLAQRRMHELRASLAPWGEQMFPRWYPTLPSVPPLPPFANDKCWKRSEYQVRQCGPRGQW